MTANAIVSGTFSDLKTVKSRSVVQMIVEIPIERGADVVAMFGFPQPGDEIHVAVARLVAEKPEPEKPKRSWDELSYAQQAGMLCSDVGFQRWIKVETAEAAAEFVRSHCGVRSRRDIGESDASREAWNVLAGQYHDFKRYGDVR